MVGSTAEHTATVDRLLTYEDYNERVANNTTAVAAG